MQTQPEHAAVGASIDSAEVARFAAEAARWWDEAGPSAALHAITPVRVGFVRDEALGWFDGGDAPAPPRPRSAGEGEGRDPRAPSRAPLPRSEGGGEGVIPLRPLAGRTLLDIGCGGGLAAEPFARMGAKVTAIDAATELVAVAAAHAQEGGLPIDYRATSAEALAATGASFDIVTLLDVVEHAADPGALLDAAGRLVRPGGLVVLSTLNRTRASYALAIVAAERVLRLVPRGTHQWDRFIKPSELGRMLRQAGLSVRAASGFAYDPLRRTAQRVPGRLEVNYLMSATRPS